MIGGYLGQRLIHLAGHPYTFDTPDTVHLVYAALLFSLSLALALRSNRIWTLVFSALFLVRLTGALSVLVLEEGRVLAYWIMTQIPVVAQCVLLAFATHSFLRRQRRGLQAPDWRMKVSR